MIKKTICIIFIFQTLIFANQKDIIDLLEQYNKSFANKEQKKIINYFDFPVSFNLQDKTITANSNLKLKLIYKKIWGDLPDYYSHSKWDSFNIQIIDDNIAIVNAEFSRYKNDGTIFYSGAGIYSLRKSNDTWKIFSMTPYENIEQAN
tara:strand:+ start:346 stop:789 length:444 start_codon:yes stop_codon:yes gene_type:complete